MTSRTSFINVDRLFSQATVSGFAKMKANLFGRQFQADERITKVGTGIFSRLRRVPGLVYNWKENATVNSDTYAQARNKAIDAFARRAGQTAAVERLAAAVAPGMERYSLPELLNLRDAVCANIAYFTDNESKAEHRVPVVTGLRVLLDAQIMKLVAQEIVRAPETASQLATQEFYRQYSQYNPNEGLNRLVSALHALPKKDLARALAQTTRDPYARALLQAAQKKPFDLSRIHVPHASAPAPRAPAPAAPPRRPEGVDQATGTEREAAAPSHPVSHGAPASPELRPASHSARGPAPASTAPTPSPFVSTVAEDSLRYAKERLGQFPMGAPPAHATAHQPQHVPHGAPSTSVQASGFHSPWAGTPVAAQPAAQRTAPPVQAPSVSAHLGQSNLSPYTLYKAIPTNPNDEHFLKCVYALKQALLTERDELTRALQSSTPEHKAVLNQRIKGNRLNLQDAEQKELEGLKAKRHVLALTLTPIAGIAISSKTRLELEGERLKRTEINEICRLILEIEKVGHQQAWYRGIQKENGEAIAAIDAKLSQFAPAEPTQPLARSSGEPLGRPAASATPAPTPQAPAPAPHGTSYSASRAHTAAPATAVRAPAHPMDINAATAAAAAKIQRTPSKYQRKYEGVLTDYLPENQHELYRYGGIDAHVANMKAAQMHGRDYDLGLYNFQQLAAENKWGQFHRAHFDWMMFPINQTKGSRGSDYCAFPAVVEKLRADNEFMQNYREGVILAVRAWGWDLTASPARPVEHPVAGQQWTNYHVRLWKMMDSVNLFGQDDLYDGLVAFVEHHNIQTKPLTNSSEYIDREIVKRLISNITPVRPVAPTTPPPRRTPVRAPSATAAPVPTTPPHATNVPVAAPSVPAHAAQRSAAAPVPTTRTPPPRATHVQAAAIAPTHVSRSPLEEAAHQMVVAPSWESLSAEMNAVLEEIFTIEALLAMTGDRSARVDLFSDLLTVAEHLYVLAKTGSELPDAGFAGDDEDVRHALAQSTKEERDSKAVLANDYIEQVRLMITTLSLDSSSTATQPATGVRSQPVGFFRGRAFNCWIHAGIQIAPHLLRSDCRVLNSVMQQYRDSQGEPVLGSQALRQEMRTVSGLSEDAALREITHDQYEDVTLVYRHLMTPTFTVTGGSNPGARSYISVPLPRDRDLTPADLTNLFDGDSARIDSNQLHNNLIIQFERTALGSRSLPIEMEMNLPGQLFSDNNARTYECHGFTVYFGAHHIAYRKGEDGVWREYNEEKVREVSAEEAKLAMKRGDSFHLQLKAPLASPPPRSVAVPSHASSQQPAIGQPGGGWAPVANAASSAVASSPAAQPRPAMITLEEVAEWNRLYSQFSLGETGPRQNIDPEIRERVQALLGAGYSNADVMRAIVSLRAVSGAIYIINNMNSEIQNEVEFVQAAYHLIKSYGVMNPEILEGHMISVLKTVDGLQALWTQRKYENFPVKLAQVLTDDEKEVMYNIQTIACKSAAMQGGNLLAMRALSIATVEYDHLAFGQINKDLKAARARLMTQQASGAVQAHSAATPPAALYPPPPASNAAPVATGVFRGGSAAWDHPPSGAAHEASASAVAAALPLPLTREASAVMATPAQPSQPAMITQKEVDAWNRSYDLFNSFSNTQYANALDKEVADRVRLLLDAGYSSAQVMQGISSLRVLSGVSVIITRMKSQNQDEGQFVRVVCDLIKCYSSEQRDLLVIYCVISRLTTVDGLRALWTQIDQHQFPERSTGLLLAEAEYKMKVIQHIACKSANMQGGEELAKLALTLATIEHDHLAFGQINKDLKAARARLMTSQANGAASSAPAAAVAPALPSPLSPQPLISETQVQQWNQNIQYTASTTDQQAAKAAVQEAVAELLKHNSREAVMAAIEPLDERLGAATLVVEHLRSSFKETPSSSFKETPTEEVQAICDLIRNYPAERQEVILRWNIADRLSSGITLEHLQALWNLRNYQTALTVLKDKPQGSLSMLEELQMKTVLQIALSSSKFFEGTNLAKEALSLATTQHDQLAKTDCEDLKRLRLRLSGQQTNGATSA